MKNKDRFRVNILFTIVLLILSLSCFFLFSGIVDRLAPWKSVVKVLSDKREDITALSASAAASSMAVAAFPGDTTTPIANELADITSYLIVLDGIVLFEEILASHVCYFAVKYLLPLICILLGFFVWTRNDYFRQCAVKWLLFALLLNCIIPLSTELITKVDQVLDFESSLVTASNLSEDPDEPAETAEGFIGKVAEFGSGIAESIGNKVTDTVQWAKQKLKEIENALTALFITSCIIPIFVLLLFLKVIQIFWSINLDFSRFRLIVKN